MVQYALHELLVKYTYVQLLCFSCNGYKVAIQPVCPPIATDRALQLSNHLSLDFNFECSGSESELAECFYQFLYEHMSCYPILVSCIPCELSEQYLVSYILR